MVDKTTFWGWLLKVGIIAVIFALSWVIRVIVERYPHIADSKSYLLIERFLLKPLLYILLIIVVIIFIMI